MRVGLIVQNLASSVTGVERYMIELTHAISCVGAAAPHLTLLTTERSAQSALAVPVEQLLPAGRWRHGSASVADVLARRIGRRLTTVAFGSATLPSVAKRARLDVVHDLTGLAPIARGAGPAATVVTVHDLISRVGIRSNDHIDNFIQRHWLKRALKRADAVISVSQATRNDVARYLEVDERRQHVVPHGVASEFRPLDASVIAPVLKVHGVRAPYVLAVGGEAPRKNLSRLVEAFGWVRDRVPELSLVVAGRAHGNASDLARQPGVSMIGYVPQADLPALYGGALVFAFPSLYEGFGLPILEAMACGTPTLCGDTSSLPEVASDAAVLVDATSVEAIRNGLLQLTTDAPLRQSLVQRGLVRAADYSWAASAAQTVAVYRSVVGSAT